MKHESLGNAILALPMSRSRWCHGEVQNSPAPRVGDARVDASSIADHLVDLPEGETRGMLKEKPGLAEVLLEIIANQPELGDKAGITVSDFSDLQTNSDVIAQIDTYLPPARKLVEILEETRAKYEDQRQRIIYALADAVERRAKHRSDGDTLLAKYQRTRQYRSMIALKAARTRRKNAQQKKTPEAPETPEAPSTT